ncbi:GPI mannosyltransferase 1-like [Anneissia japonica]|uniref:GPI mannosyltransferase 1-like n=1 Tax=Anneissia japonica TaxID=1529436 RepID=UPI001425AB0E|nr:GPI mannosyltransferase 1-like [Anneissia japonica]XP_033114085.1 GPI mannosyltransferase 1-like [Anneissia japonica]
MMWIHICWFGGVVLRFGLLIYGHWQDSTMAVKFTDVDYYVFSDAAKHISKGESPYERSTYRYTPVLAFLLLPNIYVAEVMGKLLFILCDLLTGIMIYKLADLRGAPKTAAVWCCALWMFNPLPAVIASRGNAESIMTMLVLSMLYFFSQGRVKMSAAVFGLAVHWKIYPITYALPMYLALADSTNNAGMLDLFWPNKKRRELVLVSAFTFLILTCLMYWQYGYEFLQESYFYHLTRRDIRHNFSPYFCLLYLTDEWSASVWLGLLTFLPQVILLVTVSFCLYTNLPVCCLVQTCIFVAFNKVSTSQYFLWYLSILPAALPHVVHEPLAVLSSFVPWILAQASWLFFAYLLEFEGQQVFLWLWLCGLLFLFSHVGLIGDFITWSTCSKCSKAPKVKTT